MKHSDLSLNISSQCTFMKTKLRKYTSLVQIKEMCLEQKDLLVWTWQLSGSWQYIWMFSVWYQIQSSRDNMSLHKRQAIQHPWGLYQHFIFENQFLDNDWSLNSMMDPLVRNTTKCCIDLWHHCGPWSLYYSQSFPCL